MTPFEAFLAFLVVMGVIAIPITAIITRKNSAIGHALAERIRRKTERKLGPGRMNDIDPTRSVDRDTRAKETAGMAETDPLALIETQQSDLREMSAKLEFLERLIEKQQRTGSDNDSR